MSTTNKKILVLHGPNLDILGMREPEIYGKTTLTEINTNLISAGDSHNITVECFQSNSESELINKLHLGINNHYSFIIINPAGFTHTSVALRDALLATSTSFIEVHLSNIFSREEFRHKSFFSDKAIAVISGLGVVGYEFALSYAIKYISKE